MNKLRIFIFIIAFSAMIQFQNPAKSAFVSAIVVVISNIIGKSIFETLKNLGK